MNQKISNENLLVGLKKQLQKVLFNQQQLLLNLEQNDLVPKYDAEKPMVFDNKTIPEMKNVLQGEYTKLENFEVVLAVVGTMKAGKSTTINAIVGKEILPNRNRPMTSLPTLIAHKKNQKEPILTCDVKNINKYIASLKKITLSEFQNDERVTNYKEIVELIQNIQQGYKFKNKYNGEEAIFSFLAHLNDLVRLSRIITEKYPKLGFPFSAYKEINSLPRIDIEFTELAKQDEQLGNLVLLDTPGPNEANIPELKNIFEQQLKRSSAVMVVMDYTQLKSQADADIREELEKLPKVEKNRLFTLVNKFDQKNANGDNEDTTKKIVCNDLLKDRIHYENIYCISAQDAFLATRLQNYINLHEQKPSFDELEWVQDFAKKTYGTRAKRLWESSEIDEILQDSQTLASESQIEIPLEMVIQESYKNAPKIAMQSALRDVDNIFLNISNYFSVHGYFNKEYQMTEDELNKIKESLVKLDNDKTILKEQSKKSILEVSNTAKKSLNEIDIKFKKIKENSSFIIKSEIIETVKYFQQEKEEEYGDKVGKSRVGKFFNAILLNEHYSKDKSQISADLEDLKKAFNTKENGIIKLKKPEMDKLSFKIDKKIQVLEKGYKKSLNEVLNPILVNFNSLIGEINSNVIEHVSQISQEFGKSGIEITLAPLAIDFEKTKTSMSLSFIDLSDAKVETRRVEATTPFAGARRWLGGFFKNTLDYENEWGYEEEKTTYLELKIDKIYQQLDKQLSGELVQPLQTHLEQCFQVFNKQLEDDLSHINLQIEELINELQSAFDAEQLPYEQKKKRKDLMNDIDRSNKSIQVEINTIRKYLPLALGCAL